MRFCPRCGIMVNDDSFMFCQSCGAEIKPIPNTPTPNTPITDPAPKKAKKKNKALPFIIIGIVLAVLVAALTLYFVVIKDYGIKKAVSIYEDVFNCKGGTSAIQDLYPDSFWDWLDEEYDLDRDYVLEEFEDRIKDDEFDFGLDQKDVKIKLKLIDIRKIEDKDAYEMISEAVAERYDVKESHISDIVRLNLKHEYDFNPRKADKEYRYYAQIMLEDGFVRSSDYAVKIYNKWYIVHIPEHAFIEGEKYFTYYWYFPYSYLISDIINDAEEERERKSEREAVEEDWYYSDEDAAEASEEDWTNPEAEAE